MYSPFDHYFNQLSIPNGAPTNQDLFSIYNSDQANLPQPIQPFFDSQMMNFPMLDMYTSFNQTAFLSPYSSSFSDDFLSQDDGSASSSSNGLLFNPTPPVTTQGPIIITTAEMAAEIETKPRSKIMRSSYKKAKESAVAQVYHCDHKGCGRVFVRKYNLSSHSVTHTGERKYACYQCPRAFVRHHDLKRHIRTHTGETPHQCRYCQRGYGRADALQRHYVVNDHCAQELQSDPTNPLHFKRKKKVHSADSE